MRRITTLLTALMLLFTMSGSCLAAETNAADASQQWALLSEAYRYTFPLVLMDWSKKSATNAAAPDQNGHAPVNQLIHAQRLATSDFRLVVTPNVDTIYTQAWLDLSKEPMVYVMPHADRFYQVQVLDAWTNTPAVLKQEGTYLFTTPDWQGTVPENVEQIVVPTGTVWLIARVVVNDEADMANVRNIQAAMQLLPLSAWLSGGEYVPPTGEHHEEYGVVPLNAVLKMGPKAYFQAANDLMKDNPPAAEDAELLERFKALGIGAGLTFDPSVLQGDIPSEWTAMLQALRQTLVAAGAKYQVALGGWKYFDAPIGNFGTAYDYRAMVALGGLGANPVEVAIYPKTDVDADGNQLNGANTYRLHFSSLPPTLTLGFWSVTAYGSDDFLIANKLNRYCVNDRSGFTLNEDGTLDIILSAEAPENEANWLPVGTDDFHLFMRIYLPDVDAIQNGWTPPVITKLN